MRERPFAIAIGLFYLNDIYNALFQARPLLTYSQVYHYIKILGTSKYLNKKS